MTRIEPTTIATQADLELFWRARMEPLGFSQPALWMTTIHDGAPSGVMIEISDLPSVPTPEDLDGFAGLLTQVAEEQPGASVAMLLVRPGGGGPTGSDCRWAAGLLRAARRATIPCEPVHLATDCTLTAIPPDALVAGF